MMEQQACTTITMTIGLYSKPFSFLDNIFKIQDKSVDLSDLLGISKFHRDPTLLHYLDKTPTVNSFLKIKTIAIYDTKLLMLLYHAKSL